MTTRTTRPKRVPISGYRDLLTVRGKDPDYVYRWVNDVDTRVDRFKEAGYDTVDHAVEVGEKAAGRASQVGSVVSKAVGKGVTSVLMRIKREWYEEDQAAKHKSIAESEADIKRTLNSGKDGTYGKVDFE